MNIKKLAKYLKEFTLDEIEMIAECDVSVELEKLMAEGKLSLEDGIYKYQDFENKVEFAVFVNSETETQNITLKTVSEIFMKDYAANFCKPNTIKTYTAILRTNVIPILGTKKVREICTEDIKRFYTICKRRGMGERRLKNSLALLNQILKYCKRENLAKTNCEFQVRRLTDKNKFSINRIIFEENI
jgi:hypothetical protein